MAKAAPVSPLAPKTIPEIPPIDGVRFAAGAAGVRYKGRTDVMLALLDEGARVAGVFTKSKCPSAPVDWCRARIEGGKARALLVNSGNANAFTGKAGKDAVKLSAKLAATATGAPERQIFLASTGVIGEPLDASVFEAVLPKLVKKASPDGWLDAARAHHDHRHLSPSSRRATALIDGVETRIAGFAKGAGMIAPDMATMLSFVFTDAAIGADALQTLPSRSVRRLVQLHHRGQRHLDLRHAAAVRHRGRRGARRAGHRKSQRPPARCVSRGARRGAARSRASGGQGRRGRAQIRRDHRRGRRDTTAPPSGSRCPSPIRRW